MYPISNIPTTSKPLITNSAASAGNQPNVPFNRMNEQLTQVRNYSIEKPRTIFSDLAYDLHEKIARKCALHTLRNLKAATSVMTQIYGPLFDQRAKRILQNALINLKENLTAGHFENVIDTLENLDLLGLLTEKEVVYLKREGVDLDSIVKGESLIQRTIKQYDPEDLRLVIKAGATINVNHVDDYNLLTNRQQAQSGAQMMILAAGCGRHGGHKMIEILLEHGVPADSTGRNGNTPLHRSISYRNNACIKILLDHQDNINIRNYNGDTALHTFIKSDGGLPGILEMLLKAGARVDIANNEGETPLSLAVRYVSEEIKQTTLLSTILDYQDALAHSVETTLKAYEIAEKLNHLPTINFLKERLNTSPYNNEV